jgi:hypothetical protein
MAQHQVKAPLNLPPLDWGALPVEGLSASVLGMFPMPLL